MNLKKIFLTLDFYQVIKVTALIISVLIDYLNNVKKIGFNLIWQR